MIESSLRHSRVVTGDSLYRSGIHRGGLCGNIQMRHHFKFWSSLFIIDSLCYDWEQSASF